MRDRYFLDTNIFIYSFDSQNPVKQKIAGDLIQKGIDNRHGFISYQVVQEFLNVATKKFNKPLKKADSKLYLSAVLMPLWKIYPGKELYTSAITISGRFNYSFYDCLIIASALEGSAGILYSEDLQHGQTIDSLRIVNPFI